MTARPYLVACGVLFLALAVGCKKHVPVAKATPPPTPAPVSTPAPAPRQETARVIRPEPTRSTPPAPAVQQPHQKSLDELLAELQDAYFDFDKYEIRPDARQALTQDSSELTAMLQANPKLNLAVQGYCDERGSAEYNLALGDRRAHEAREFLAQMGIPKDQLKPISYGKEKPVCTDESEPCWQKNRHAHLAQNQ